VFNSPLPHPVALRRLVGPTRVIDRDRRFSVAVSTRRSAGRAERPWSGSSALGHGQDA
jgi:hypothetical protein